ncbi:hypothetical protein ARTHRO9V_280065 [Arthrobacter sp. 9V]|nr:hypothetical protein ARTHRO9V_280065 [Arthrobacter sp. 9V]
MRLLLRRGPETLRASYSWWHSSSASADGFRYRFSSGFTLSRCRLSASTPCSWPMDG